MVLRPTAVGKKLFFCLEFLVLIDLNLLLEGRVLNIPFPGSEGSAWINLELCRAQMTDCSQ